MKDKYVEKIIELWSKLCQKPDDYTKAKVKINNLAIDELIPLIEELTKDHDLSEKVFEELLENNDPFIRQNAASHCLSLNLHIEKSVKTLKGFLKHGKPWEAMGAERSLKIWRGEIGPNDPG